MWKSWLLFFFRSRCVWLSHFGVVSSLSCSTWTQTFLLWWRRAQTFIWSEALLASFWLTAWPVASSTRPSRERPGGRCTSFILRTGWWWVLESYYSKNIPMVKNLTEQLTWCRDIWKGNAGGDHVILPLACVRFRSMNTGAPSLAGTSSLWLSCTRGWSSTTALCSAHWIDHMPLRCSSSPTFSPPPFLQWRPRWLRRASPAVICSVSFPVWQIVLLFPPSRHWKECFFFMKKV